MIISCFFVQRIATSASDETSYFSVSNALRWLPEDTEALQVRRNFQLSALSADCSVDTIDAKDAILWNGPTIPLALIKQHPSLRKLLIGREVVLAIEGGRNYREPRGPAENLYDGCHMLLFKDAIPKEFEKILQTSADKTFNYKQHTIRSLESMWGFEKRAVYITSPASNLLFIATDKTFLQTLLDRMNSKKAITKRAFPDTLPEWKYLDTTKRYWAIRHFHEPRHLDLLELSFYPEAGYFSKSRPLGVAVQLNDQHIDSLIFTVLSADPAVIEQTSKLMGMFSDGTVNPIVQKRSEDAWTFSPQAHDDLFSFFGVVQTYLGHAGYP